MKLAFIIDPIAKLDHTHEQRGHDGSRRNSQPPSLTAEQLAVIDGRAAADLQTIQIEPVKQRWIAIKKWYQVGQPELIIPDEI
jgi:hypothetical protein